MTYFYRARRDHGPLGSTTDIHFNKMIITVNVNFSHTQSEVAVNRGSNINLSGDSFSFY